MGMELLIHPWLIDFTIIMGDVVAILYIYMLGHYFKGN
jgi:hypothetical protein